MIVFFRRVVPLRLYSMDTVSLRKSLSDKETPVRVVFVRFTAKWCAPCRSLAPAMHAWEEHLGTSDSYVRFMTADVDECIELYAYFKRMRQVRALPTILAFRTGRAEQDPLMPDFHHLGSDHSELDRFIEDTIRACVQ